MNIDHGLMNGQVLQRNRQDLGAAIVTGRCKAGGEVQCRIRRGGRIVTGFNWIKAGVARKNRFMLKLKKLPVGGPYEISIRIASKQFDSEGRQDACTTIRKKGDSDEQVSVSDVFVGDVWILGGQSNMEGIGFRHAGHKPNPRVRAFYMRDEWGEAKDPLHILSEAVDPIHWDLSGGKPDRPWKDRYVGPGVAFGNEMHRRTGVPQGTILCAHGGTSMAQWDPKLKKHGGKSLYGAMIRRFSKLGQPIAGVLWYQGCSDANSESTPDYTSRMKNLVASMRRDFGNPKLPFVAVQISRVCGPEWEQNARFWNSIQDQQRLLTKSIDRLAVVPTVDLELDDPIHISGASQQRLGVRIADAADVLTRGKRVGKPPIELKSVKLIKGKLEGAADIEVRFSNVAGGLRAAGRASGFAIADEGHEVTAIYRIDLDGSRAILRTGQLPETIARYDLHYGLGVNPFCNITDETGRSLPVFGPVSLG
jgi:sialate O-acetylesterase